MPDQLPLKHSVPGLEGARLQPRRTSADNKPGFSPRGKSHPLDPISPSQTPAPGLRSPILWARTTQIALLAIVTFAMIGATRSQYDRVGNQLMCACGCGQILLECNHVGCPDSPVMIRELRAQVATGASDKTIFDWFITKYGAIILAAPIRGGFDRVAWVVPIAVFLLGTLGTFAIVWLWKQRAARFPAPALPNPEFPAPQNSALRDRIRQETEY